MMYDSPPSRPAHAQQNRRCNMRDSWHAHGATGNCNSKHPNVRCIDSNRQLKTSRSLVLSACNDRKRRDCIGRWIKSRPTDSNVVFAWNLFEEILDYRISCCYARLCKGYLMYWKHLTPKSFEYVPFLDSEYVQRIASLVAEEKNVAQDNYDSYAEKYTAGLYDDILAQICDYLSRGILVQYIYGLESNV
jgi:hypothetical protein